MKNYLAIKISGLKCDLCEYRNNSILFSDYINHINSECPKCKNILLTHEEYNECLLYYKIINFINIILNIFKWISPMYYYNLISNKKSEESSIKMDFPKRKK
jgi:hypothetical protein